MNDIKSRVIVLGSTLALIFLLIFLEAGSNVVSFVFQILVSFCVFEILLKLLNPRFIGVSPFAISLVLATVASVYLFVSIAFQLDSPDAIGGGLTHLMAILFGFFIHVSTGELHRSIR